MSASPTTRAGRWKTKESRDRSISALKVYAERDKRWRGNLTIPEGLNPLVRELFKLMNDQQTTMREVAQRAGVQWGTISDWRYKGNGQGPGLANVIAVANALDYDVKLIKRRLDPRRDSAWKKTPVSSPASTPAVTRQSVAPDSGE